MKKGASNRQTRQEQVLEAVRAWQANGTVHSLTCGNDSSHRPLEPIPDGVTVVLRCQDCGYVQPHIPDVVIAMGSKLPSADEPMRGPVVPPIKLSPDEAGKALLKQKPTSRTPKASDQ